jgi:acetyl/propionyl-CoA carboxylase alpha subunit
MYAASVALATAIGYVGAGTVEFLVSGEGDAQEFFFLEMNTRLQVEHPVTEMVTGLDLVAWQLAVAQGEPLPLAQNEIERHGHAIEVRLYAEDPARDFLPSTGTVLAWDDGGRTGVRIDAGITTGSTVSAFYDPMLAKLIAHAPDRDGAAARLAEVLRDMTVLGLTTNRLALAALLTDESFLDGATTTDFLDRRPELLAADVPDDVVEFHLLVAALVLADMDADDHAVPSGWRNVTAAPEVWQLGRGCGRPDAAVAWAWSRTGNVYWAIPSLSEADRACAAQQLVAGIEPVRGASLTFTGEQGDDLFAEYRVEVDGVRETVWARLQLPEGSVEPTAVAVDARGWLASYDVVEPWDASAHEAATGGPSTPVPGTVTHVAVAPGDAVEAGDALVVLEAMKMEHTIRADADGVVAEVHVAVGQSVEAHVVVVTLGEQS